MDFARFLFVFRALDTFLRDLIDEGCRAMLRATCRQFHAAIAWPGGKARLADKMARAGHYYLIGAMKYGLGPEHLMYACSGRDFNAQISMILQQSASTIRTYSTAFGHGQLFEWAVRTGFPWNKELCYLAIQNGHLDLLIHAHCHGAGLENEMLLSAVRGPNTKILIWLYEQGPKWTS